MVPASIPTSPYSGERLGEVRAGPWLVTHLAFGPGERLSRHAHANAIVTCVLTGALHEHAAHRSLDLTHRQAYVRPAAEPHSNTTGRDGVRMVLIEARGERSIDSAVDRLLSELSVRRAPRASSMAHQLEREVRLRDAATPLAVEGLVLSLLGALVRSEARPAQASSRALTQVREYLDAHFRSPVRLADLAALVDVEPGHLARAFRRAFGLSPAAYQRARQVAWVTEQLEDRERTISRIAAEAGFADHSHLTRCYRAATGRTPSEVRRSLA